MNMHEPFSGCYGVHFHSETIIKNIIREVLNVSEKHLAQPFSQSSLFWGIAVFLWLSFKNPIK